MASSAYDVARQEAISRGWGYVLNSLVLLGIAREGGLAAKVLEELGAHARIVAGAIGPGGDVPGPLTDESGRPWQTRDAPEVEQLRGRSEGFALSLAIPDDSICLLLALAFDPYGTHVPVLTALEIDRRSIVAGVAARGLPVPVNDPPPDLRPLVDRVILPREQALLIIADLVQLTASDPKRYFNEGGGGSWGYGAVAGQPDATRILAAADIRLREVVSKSLGSAGFAEPPASAWE